MAGKNLEQHRILGLKEASYAEPIYQLFCKFFARLAAETFPLFSKRFIQWFSLRFHLVCKSHESPKCAFSRTRLK